MPPRPAPTHFLCIPLAGPQLARSLAAFRADVTAADPGTAGYAPATGAAAIPDRAVRPPGTLHLTLGVMSLRSEAAVTRAVELLRGMSLGEVLEQARAAAGVKEPAAQATGGGGVHPSSSSRIGENENRGKGLSVTLRGLSAMQTPANTSVLYVPPLDPTLVLRRFCEALRTRFIEAGFIVPEERPLLLHATVVNTIYVRNGGGGSSSRSSRGGRGGGRGGGGGRGQRERLTVDARDIIDRYEDHVWAEGMPVEEVRICRMGAKKIQREDGEEDEAYEVEGEITF